jgi:hypothetical protein
MNIYYHGTDQKGLFGIIRDRKIGTKYFDGICVFLSKDFETANLHGQYVHVISGIDESNIFTDDVNDGYLHKGYIDVKYVIEIRMIENDRRIFRDFINGLIEKYENKTKSQ